MSAAGPYPPPNARRLRIFSFDPALAARYELAGMSNITIDIPWEDDLQPGPIDEYIEVVDIDLASNAVYPPVDLNSPNLLAADGLAPSESDPGFHQQMCYAVARKTIEHFERALGRKALWSTHSYKDPDNSLSENYVPRLRIYPHALRQQNAYYSPQKKALLFGYFTSREISGASAPGVPVFSCLSHDIIAHETTHALLDGVHPRFDEPVNEDVLAFHEAFADIVALFQHFSYPGVLRDQIARTRGDLARQSILGELAQQFAQASGRGDALRSYLGKKNKDGVWIPIKPDPALLGDTPEPHDRGAILVAAVFGAFTKVYQGQTRDLFRIATEGTGVLRDGDIHPDLVNRLAQEAERCADRALQMCIRAIDYCPPVGITFGDYLRAVVTADYDMNPIDREKWRLAFIESFREWGIAPRTGRPMAEDSLLWPTEEQVISDMIAAEDDNAHMTVEDAKERGRNAVSRMFQHAAPQTDDETYSRKASRTAAAPSAGPSNVFRAASIYMPRFDLWLDAEKKAAMFHAWLMDEDLVWMSRALGLIVEISECPKTISAKRRDPNRANIEIHSLRTAMKRGPLGWPEQHMVVVVTQWRAGYFDREKQKIMDETPGASSHARDFKYRAGCTLLMDPENMRIRRVIRTRGNVANEDELERMRRYLLDGLAPPNAFAGVGERLGASAEPFAFLHSHAGA